MSRTITPCIDLPSSGNTVTIPFPDIARPVPGGWMVSVELRSTTSPPAETIMQLQLAGKILASSKFTPTTSVGSYSLMVTEEDLEGATMGLCSSVGPVLVISDGLQPCCDPEVILPESIHATIFSSGIAAPINGMEVQIPVLGSVTVPICGSLVMKFTTDHQFPPPECNPEYLLGVAGEFFSNGEWVGGVHTSLSCSFFHGFPLRIGAFQCRKDCNGALLPQQDESTSVEYTL